MLRFGLYFSRKTCLFPLPAQRKAPATQTTNPTMTHNSKSKHIRHIGVLAFFMGLMQLQLPCL
ncbi:hypothetical protein M145_3260 [Bacteroides fragilis str. 34-F-2 |nr:hypothetical protein M077_3793 [Bacteroides fragilis str. 2-F-2 \